MLDVGLGFMRRTAYEGRQSAAKNFLRKIASFFVMWICWLLRTKTLAHEIRNIACKFDNGTDELRRASEEIISDNAASNNGRALIQSSLDNVGINGLARAHLKRKLITTYIL
jgi:hypothetical protein